MTRTKDTIKMTMLTEYASKVVFGEIGRIPADAEDAFRQLYSELPNGHWTNDDQGPSYLGICDVCGGEGMVVDVEWVVL